MKIEFKRGPCSRGLQIGRFSIGIEYQRDGYKVIDHKGYYSNVSLMFSKIIEKGCRPLRIFIIGRFALACHIE